MDDITYKTLHDKISELTSKNKKLSTDLHKMMKSRNHYRRLIRKYKNQKLVCYNCGHHINPRRQPKMKPYKKLSKNQIADLNDLND